MGYIYILWFIGDISIVIVKNHDFKGMNIHIR